MFDDTMRVLVIVNNNFTSITNFLKLLTETHPKFRETGYELDALLLTKQTKFGQRQRQWNRNIFAYCRKNYDKNFQVHERFLDKSITHVNQTIIHQETLQWVKEQLAKGNEYTHISFGKIAPNSFDIVIQNILFDIEIIPSKWALVDCLEYLDKNITQYILCCAKPRISEELESRAIRLKQRSINPKKFMSDVHTRSRTNPNQTVNEYKDYVAAFHLARIEAKTRLANLDTRPKYKTKLVKPCKQCGLCKTLSQLLDVRSDLAENHPSLKPWVIPKKRVAKRLQNAKTRKK